MKTKKYNYCYITTNLVNGKQYIGDHSTNHLEDSYLGSGSLLTKKIKEYGKEKFNKKILEFFNTREEAYFAQEIYINLYKTHVSTGGYNISPKGGYSIYSIEAEKKNRQAHLGKKHSEETKAKISKNHARWNKGVPSSKESKEKNRIAHIGKNHTEETKKQMSISQSGEKNGFYGMTHTPKVGEKMSKSKIGNQNRLGKFHNVETKRKVSDGLKKYWSKRKEDEAKLLLKFTNI